MIVNNMVGRGHWDVSIDLCRAGIPGESALNRGRSICMGTCIAIYDVLRGGLRLERPAQCPTVMSPLMKWTVIIVSLAILIGVDAGRYNWHYTRTITYSVERAVTWTVNTTRSLFR